MKMTYIWLLCLSLLGLGGCKLADIVEEEGTAAELSLSRQSVLLSSDERYLFVSVGNLGLDIVDVSDSNAPHIVKNYPTDDFTYELALQGQHLFLANGIEGVEVLDITSVSAPKHLAWIADGDENSTSIALFGSSEAAVGSAEGVRLYDISQLTAVRFLGKYDTNGTVRDLAFSEDGLRLYLANFSYGFERLDISRPTRMELLDAVAQEGGSIDIELETLHQRAYIASLTSALKAIDLSQEEIEEAEILYDAHDAGTLWDITLGSDDRYLYLAKGERGLEILDNSDSAHPYHVSGVDSNGTARGVAVNRAQTRLYLADGKEGLKIFDISDKSAPRRIGFLNF